jgi:Mn2+/Fe2+ NRAMP family transporter
MWLSQVVNAVLLPAVLVFMLILANDGSLMKNWRNSRPTNVFAIVLSILVTIATFALLVAPLLTRG